MSAWQNKFFGLVTGNLILHSFMDVLIWMAFSLLICVYWPEIFCLKAVVLSACMYVLTFQDQHTLPKWNILSDQINSIAFSLAHTSRDRTSDTSEIFSQIRLTPLPFPLLVWAEREYFTLGGCAGPGRPIHTYEQREQQLWDRIFLANTHEQREREKQMDFMPFNCQEDRILSSLLKLW